MNPLFAFLGFYLMIIYIVRITHIFEEGAASFTPNFLSFCLFLLGIFSGYLILCFVFIFEVLFTMINNPEKEVSTIVLKIVVPVLLGAITFGILDLFDIGGFEAGEDAGFGSETAGDLQNSASSSVRSENLNQEGIDLDGDGQVEGFDTDGDGKIDQNIIGVEVPDTEVVEGYIRQDGTLVESYIRSEPDASTVNNLDPES